MGDLGEQKCSFNEQPIYHCKVCDYKCSKKFNWNRHLSTAKHIEVTSGDNSVTALEQNEQSTSYCCKICNKTYNSRNGLWKHSKKCEPNKEYIHPNPTTNLNFITPELVLELIKDNKEMKQIILEQNNTISSLVKNGINNVTNTNCMNNNNNKTFNIQFFLNETCKNAMNITDFVDSINLQLSDLEKIGEIGYTQGISNIITTNLKALDVTQRPVHCTDKKRGIVYIKDENKWEKESDEKTKLKHMIIKVSNKNIKLLPQFREKYPDYKVSTSRTSDKYDKIVLEAMGGGGDNDKEKTEKIIQNISKCVVIDKYE
jgi:hypothetical protein